MATILQLKVAKRQPFEKVSLEHCVLNCYLKEFFLLLDVIVQSFMVDYFLFPTSFLFVFLPVLVVSGRLYISI